MSSSWPVPVTRSNLPRHCDTLPHWQCIAGLPLFIISKCSSYRHTQAAQDRLNLTPRRLPQHCRPARCGCCVITGAASSLHNSSRAIWEPASIDTQAAKSQHTNADQRQLVLDSPSELAVGGALPIECIWITRRARQHCLHRQHHFGNAVGRSCSRLACYHFAHLKSRVPPYTNHVLRTAVAFPKRTPRKQSTQRSEDGRGHIYLPRPTWPIERPAAPPATMRPHAASPLRCEAYRFVLRLG